MKKTSWWFWPLIVGMYVFLYAEGGIDRILAISCIFVSVVVGVIVWIAQKASDSLEKQQRKSEEQQDKSSDSRRAGVQH